MPSASTTVNIGGATDGEVVDEVGGDGRTGRRCPLFAPLTTAPLSEAATAELARLLGALADPVRLRILSLVVAHGEVCSCDLEAPLGRSQPTVSHHTKLLAEAGLLVGERRGRWTWWRLAPDRLVAIRRALGG